MTLSPQHELALLLNYAFLDKAPHIMTLMSHFSSIDDFKSGFDELMAQTSFAEKTQVILRNKLNEFHLDTYLQELDQFQIRFVFYDDPEYPTLLKAISDPPYVLFYRGNIELVSQPILGVVGPRACTEYGRNVTKRMVREIVPHLTICSGLAKGIDTIAHQAALEHPAPTISVVATGLDEVYPVENKKLFFEIVEKGVVLSEYPTNTEPLAYRFPQRNRIISGLSKGILVAEAAVKSGSLITAQLALEHGRDVFAVPGSIFSEMSVGTHLLIQDGAKLVRDPNDILDEYFPRRIPQKGMNSADKPIVSYEKMGLTDVQLQIIQRLMTEPLTLDELVMKTNFTVQSILESLTLLELGNIIIQKGMEYQLVRP